MEQPFYAIENVLSDKSVIWEVWQSGSAQRLGSSASDFEALNLARNLNNLVTDWAAKTVENTVDC